MTRKERERYKKEVEQTLVEKFLMDQKFASEISVKLEVLLVKYPEWMDHVGPWNTAQEIYNDQCYINEKR